MKKKELKDLEFIANGVLIENESNEGLESDRRKRLLATSFVAVRNMTGMNRKEFAEWLAIPYRTMQDWELGTSQVPEYVLRLVAYKVLMLFAIRLVLLPVRLLLLVALCLWGAIGGFVGTVTSILGFVMMVTSVFCVITKIMDLSVFVEMFLAGAAFEAVPILLIKLGEEGMLGLMDLLCRV